MTGPNPQEGGKHVDGLCAPWKYVPWHIAEGDSEVRSRDGWLICTTCGDRYAQLIAAAPALLEALKGARAIVAEELDCLIRSCSLDGTAATLDADARDEVVRVQASLDKIDAALALTGART